MPGRGEPAGDRLRNPTCRELWGRARPRGVPLHEPPGEGGGDPSPERRASLPGRPHVAGVRSTGPRRPLDSDAINHQLPFVVGATLPVATHGYGGVWRWSFGSLA